MGPSATADQYQAVPNMALDPETVGTAYLKGNQVFVAPDDELLSESIVLYLDHDYDINEEWTMIETSRLLRVVRQLRNKCIRFSQQGESYVYENQSSNCFRQGIREF